MSATIDGDRSGELRRRHRIRAAAVAAASIGVLTVAGRALGYGFGGRTIVRCRRGHLFSTVWIPGVKLKAVDLLVARVQWCPVGRHVSLVTPVRERDLTAAQRAFARTHRDVPVP